MIIGGGAAGVGASEFLSSQNVDFVLVESEGKIGGRIKHFKFGGYNVEDGANWIHGQQDMFSFDDMSRKPLFINPLWRWQEFHNGTKKYMGGNFTTYENKDFRTDMGTRVNQYLVEECLKEVENSIENCKERADKLRNKYCNEGIDIEDVEKEDIPILQCIHEYMDYAS